VIHLAILLISISLVEAFAALPIYIVPQIKILSLKKPFFRCWAYISGIFFTYLSIGLLAAFGMQSVFDQLNAIMYAWMQHPTPFELILEFLIGIVLIYLGKGLRKPRVFEPEKRRFRPTWIEGDFMLGAFLTIIALPTAFPYVAAIAKMVRAPISDFDVFILIIYYNLIFISPLVFFLILRAFRPEKTQEILKRLNVFFETRGRTFAFYLFLILGILLMADSVGSYFGYPVLPPYGN